MHTADWTLWCEWTWDRGWCGCRRVVGRQYAGSETTATCNMSMLKKKGPQKNPPTLMWPAQMLSPVESEAAVDQYLLVKRVWSQQLKICRKSNIGSRKSDKSTLYSWFAEHNMFRTSVKVIVFIWCFICCWNSQSIDQLIKRKSIWTSFNSELIVLAIFQGIMTNVCSFHLFLWC